MANLVKLKRRIVIGSVLAMLLISAFETNFFKTPKIKRWSEKNLLTWKDFNGIVPPLTSYDAVISSRVYLEYDSLSAAYRAYAGQNNYESWTKESMLTSRYGLKHEQYHFNITALFAKKFNEVIAQNPDLSLSYLNKRLWDINNDLSEMQEEYDDETDHSLKEGFQNYWEYKIDSMLMRYEDNEGLFTDHHSGISARFPFRPDYIITKDAFLLRRGFWLERYNMRFRILTTYDVYRDTSRMEAEFVSFLEKNRFVNIKSKKSFDKNMFLLETECVDTVNKRYFFDMIYYNYPYEYQATVYLPSSERDNELYNKMKESFFNNIQIKPQEAYWASLFEKDPKELTAMPKPNSKADLEALNKVCVNGYSDFSVLYHVPFSYQDFVLLPFKIAKHNFDEVEDVIIIVNDKKIFTQELDTAYQIVKLDKEYLEQGKNFIQFGYTIKADSISECYYFYSAIAEYEHEI